MRSGQSSDCDDGRYELMSVDDLQMLGVHVGRGPHQRSRKTNQVVMIMTREDCGKETKMVRRRIGVDCAAMRDHLPPTSKTNVDECKLLNHGVDVH